MTTNHSRMRGMRVFPMMCIAMMIVMAVACLLFFARDGFRPPWAYWMEGRTPETALEIAEKRYARGDIGREEFQRIRQTLLNQDETTGDAKQ